MSKKTIICILILTAIIISVIVVNDHQDQEIEELRGQIFRTK